VESEQALILSLETEAEKTKDPGRRDKLMAEAEKHRQKLIDLLTQYGKVLNDVDTAEGEYQSSAIKSDKERIKYIEKLTDETEKFVEQLNAANEERKFELSIMSKSQKQQAVLIEQRKVDLAVREKLLAIEKEIDKQQKAGNLKAVEELRAQHQRIREEAERTKAAISETLPLYQQATESARQQQEFMSNLEKSMTDMLVKWIDEGKSGWDSFLDYLKTTAKATLIKIPVQWAMNAIGGMFGGAGGGGGGNLLSGITSLFGGAGQNAGQSFFSTFSSVFSQGMSSLFGGNGFFSSIMGGGAGGFASTFASSGVGQWLGLSTALQGPTTTGAALTGTTLTGAGSAFLKMVPIIGWIITGMMTSMNLWKQGWRAENDDRTARILGGNLPGSSTQVFSRLFGSRWGAILSGSAIQSRLFGHKTPEARSGGVQGTLSLGGFDGEMFQDFVRRGGLFRSDKWNTETAPMDRAMRLLINNTIGKVPKQMTDLLEEFGKDFDSVFGEDWSRQLRIILADKGNWDDVGERLAKETTRVYRDMSITAVEAIREGWGKYVSDLKDLSPEEFQIEIQKIFGSLNILADNKGIQERLFGVSGLLEEDFAALMDAGEKIYETISRLAETFSVTNDLTRLTGIKFAGEGLASADTRQALVDEAGGADVLSELIGNYWGAFATETEQFSRLGESLVSTFGDMKLAIPSTVEAYKEMVAAQDMSTEEGRKNAMALMGVVQLWQQTVGVLETMRVNMGNTIDGLRRSVEFGGLDDQARYNKLKKEADQAYEEFQSATDPAEIQKLFDRITANMSETWNMLSDDQKAASRAEYLAKLDELEAEKDRRIDAAKEQYTGVAAAQENIADSGNKLAQAILDVAGQLGADISDIVLRDTAPNVMVAAGLDESTVQQLADSLVSTVEALPNLLKPLLLDINTVDGEDVMALTREMLAQIRQESNINGSGEAQIQSAAAMADAARNAGASLEDAGASVGNILQRAIAGVETRLAQAVPKEIVVRVEQVRYASNEV
jgi:hypothetical protein